MAVTPGGVAVGGADGIAVASFAVDLFALVAIDGVIADEGEGAIGEKLANDESSQKAGELEPTEVHVLADGAEWIGKSANRVLTGSLQTLDIYDALVHVALAAQALYGEGSEAAEALRERGQHALLAEGWSGLCRLVAQEYAQGDTPKRRAALEKLVGYFAKHSRRLDYAERLRSGRAIGSGVVKGQAKRLGLRLKARGARWKVKNVQSMTALVCVRTSDQWEAYWAYAA